MQQDKLIGKSIFLLCEYDISYKIVNNLYNNDIDLNKFKNNIEILYTFFVPNSIYIQKINRAIKCIEVEEKTQSLYSLFNYGLSLNIIEKLIQKDIEIDRINHDFLKRKYINDSTITKIINAYLEYTNDYNSRVKSKAEIENDSYKFLFEVLKKEFDNSYFSMDDIYNLKMDNYYNNEKLNFNIEQLLLQKYLIKIKDKYYIPDYIESLSNYGVSQLLINKLKNENINLLTLTKEQLEKNNISKFCIDSIFEALNKFKQDIGYKEYITNQILFEKMQFSFGHNEFNMLDILNMELVKEYNLDTLERNIENLLSEKKILKNYDKYYIPYDINDLNKYIPSKQVKNLINKNKLTLKDINKEYFENSNISIYISNQLLKAFEKFKNDTGYKPELNFEILKNEIKKESFTKEDIIEANIGENYNIKNINDVLYNSLINNELIKEDNIYYFVYPNLIEIINSIENVNYRGILLSRLNGGTLEEVGETYELTRERVRQIVKKEVGKIHKFKENRYLEFFIKYNLDSEMFCEIFKISNITYNFFKEKYQVGNLSLEEMLDDPKIDYDQKQIIRKHFNMIYYNQEYLIVSKKNILIAILKEIEDKISYIKIKELYNMIIDKYSLDLPKYLNTDIRNIEGILNRSCFVLMSFGKKCRYYDINNIENNIKEELMQLLNIEPGIYSSELFFNNNPLLMKKIDIRDEYELHNLLKKIIYDKNIIFSRMPDIYINCNNKYEYIKNIIQELAPIDIEQFIEIMRQNNGYKLATFRAYIQNEFSNNIENNVLVYDSPKFTEEQYMFFKSILKEDIYSTKTIKEILVQKYDVNDFRLLNNMNFSKLNYKVRENYIIKNHITNLDKYFDELIENVEYFELTYEMKKTASTFYSYISKLIYKYKLFKYDDSKYITINRLKNMGIDEIDIQNYIKTIQNILPINKYFNLDTIDFSYNNKLINLNLPKCFYETLIMTITQTKSISINNNLIFIKTDEIVNKEKFINSFIIKSKTHINEIKKQIKEQYNIDISINDIKLLINTNRYILQTNTNYVYLDKESYENDITDIDILKYID